MEVPAQGQLPLRENPRTSPPIDSRGDLSVSSIKLLSSSPDGFLSTFGKSESNRRTNKSSSNMACTIDWSPMAPWPASQEHVTAVGLEKQHHLKTPRGCNMIFNIPIVLDKSFPIVVTPSFSFVAYPQIHCSSLARR